MQKRKSFMLNGGLLAVILAALPFRIAADASHFLQLVSLSAVAQESGDSDGNSDGDADGGDTGTDTDSTGSDANSTDGGTGSTATDASSGATSGDTGATGSTGSGSTSTSATSVGDVSTGAVTGSDTSDDAATSTGAGVTAPSISSFPPAPAPPVGSDIEVNRKGASITVRHQNGTTEKISQGRYEMRDSRARTIINRQATPSDASRLQSFSR